MSRIQAPAAVEKHSIPPFSAAILKYSYSAVSPRSNPAKAAFTTGIRKTAFGACSPPCSTHRCRKRLIKSGSFAHSLYRALGCRRRMQHTRFGGQQYFGRHRKRYCSAPPFDANQSRFLNGQTAQKLFRKYLSEETAKFGCTVTTLPSTSPANASYSLEKLAAEWGSAIRAVLVI